MIISIVITQYFVFLAWIAFRVHDTNNMIYAMQKYILIDFQTTDTILFVSSHKIPLIFMISFILLHYISYRKSNLSEIISNFRLRYWFVFLTGVTLLILLFFNGKPEDFIYFKF